LIPFPSDAGHTIARRSNSTKKSSSPCYDETAYASAQEGNPDSVKCHHAFIMKEGHDRWGDALWSMLWARSNYGQSQQRLKMIRNQNPLSPTEFHWFK